MDIELSVLIPTYNRKEKLFRTLTVLQGQYQENFQVVILDNASNYSIENEVLTGLDPRFIKNIKVVRQKYNIGMGNNIAWLFTVCETKWGWLLGDDDIIFDDAVGKVLKKISEKPDYAGFWFALENGFTDTVTLSNPEQLIKIKNERELFNDSCYLSNKVYNFNYINLFSDVLFTYAYSMISFSLAIFELLKHNLKYEIIFGDPVVRHPGFGGNDGKPTWGVVRVASGMRTIVDYEATTDQQLKKEYIRCTYFGWKQLILNCLCLGERPEKGNRYLINAYNECYRRYLKFPERAICYLIIRLIYSKSGFRIGYKIYQKKYSS